QAAADVHALRHRGHFGTVGLGTGDHRGEVGAAALEAIGGRVGDVVADGFQLRVDGVDAGQRDVEAHVCVLSGRDQLARGPLKAVMLSMLVSPTDETFSTGWPAADMRRLRSRPLMSMGGVSCEAHSISIE